MGDGIRPVRVSGDGWKFRVTEFAESEVFDRLFREGMSLVEEAAAYLDGPGRQESRQLDRGLALCYAAESMEVTTRLMQAASWLVVQRAVREKDMTVDEAGEEKFRLNPPSAPREDEFDKLPDELKALVRRSRALYDRVWRLDAAIYAPEETDSSDNPVMKQLDRLRNAAESGVFDPLAIWRDD